MPRLGGLLIVHVGAIKEAECSAILMFGASRSTIISIRMIIKEENDRDIRLRVERIEK